MANRSPLDILGETMKNALAGAVADVAETALESGVQIVKNSIRGNPATRAKEPDDEYEDEENVIDVEVQARDANSPIPIAFDAFDAEKNLDCAVAVWKMYGLSSDECEDDNRVPDIIAQHEPSGLSFVGTQDELRNFCSHNDLDDNWIIYGIDAENYYDSSAIAELARAIPRDTAKYVAMTLSRLDVSESEQVFKDFHWDKNETVAKVVRDIPYMNHVPLTMLGMAKAIIYYAQKNGETQTYIHEFGEDSGTHPVLYALPIPDGEEFPRSMLIHGGNMRVEPRGIVD